MGADVKSAVSASHQGVCPVHILSLWWAGQVNMGIGMNRGFVHQPYVILIQGPREGQQHCLVTFPHHTTSPWRHMGSLSFSCPGKPHPRLCSSFKAAEMAAEGVAAGTGGVISVPWHGAC